MDKEDHYGYQRGGRALRPASEFILTVTLLEMCLLTTQTRAVYRVNDRTNMWVTWANHTGNLDFCLSMQSATSPFKTCLVGIPGVEESAFAAYATNNCHSSPTVASCTATLIRSLNTTLPWDPQELELLGAKAVGSTSKGHTQTCVTFGDRFSGRNGFETFIGDTQPHARADKRWNESGWTEVSPGPNFRPWDTGFCGTNETTLDGYNVSLPLGAYGAVDLYSPLPSVIGPLLWNNNTPKALPPNVFLICGDRAWQGIPKNAYGGPCYLGKLTLFAPHQRDWLNLTKITHRVKRGVPLDDSCRDDVQLWSTTANIFATAFFPGLAAAQALKQLERLTCWSVKQANVTTEVLSQLLHDQDSLRHAFLQDRAAIDFLLLAHGHGCEDIEGMCCFNLSHHSASIHKKLAWLESHTQRVVKNVNLFDEWLQSAFSGLSPWLLSLLKEGLRLVGIVLLVLIILRIAYACIRKSVERVTQTNILLAQKQKGGIVGEWLAERGHWDYMQLVGQQNDTRMEGATANSLDMTGPN
ncbi:uncharacterized protein LOC142027156 [Buteo buteo]|uniref:uncharacterized protein LOC142027156 n=1 Tax=Buteo buteo TaxID=30397 RepID=UPI003EBDB393